jgi:hypothetical protein
LTSWIAKRGYQPLVSTSHAWIIYNGQWVVILGSGKKAVADLIVSRMGGGHEMPYNAGF